MTLHVGDEGGGVRFLGSKALGVVHAILQVGNHEYIIGVVVQPELHVPQVAAVVGELLENVNAVGVDMAAVLQSVVISSVGALPSQLDFVGVILVAHLSVGGQSGRIGNPHGAVGIAALHAVGVNGGCLVDLRQTGIGHADGHSVGCVIVSHGEFAGVLGPGGDFVIAASIAEKLDDHIVLVVFDALAQSVRIGVLAQAGCLGGNRGQGADDLVVHHIARGCGGSVSVTVLDVGQAAVVLAGGVFVFTDGLFEVGVASLVLGVHAHIVIPRRAVDGGHGQGHEEGIAGGGHVFRDASLHNEVKPLLHVGCRGVAGNIRFGHSHTAVLHSRFQRIFHGGGIGSQRSGQLVVEHIAGEIVDAVVGLVGVCGGQTDGRQHGGAAVGTVESIQHTHPTLAIHQFTVHGNVSDAEVGKLHALNGVLAQLVDNRVVM